MEEEKNNEIDSGSIYKKLEGNLNVNPEEVVEPIKEKKETKKKHWGSKVPVDIKKKNNKRINKNAKAARRNNRPK